MNEFNNGQVPGKNQPIARTGERKVATTGNQAIPPQAPQADIFKSVYREQKITNQQIISEEAVKIQKEADKQLFQAQTPVTVVNTAQVAEEDKKNKTFNILFIIVLILTIVLLAASVIFLLIGMKDEEEPAGDITTVIDETNTDSAKIVSPFSYERTYNIEFPVGMKEEFKPLYAQNQDFIGWLTVPGTCIDTPVYQKKSNDEYYLKHDNYGTYTKYGIPFIESVHDITNMSRNTAIYGHNFDHKLIFDELHNYKDPEYYKKYPVIEFSTLYADYKYKIIAAFHTNGESAGDNGYLFYYVAPEFGDKCMMEFHDELLQRSYIHTGVDVQPTDKLLTLSTCTYFFDTNGAVRNARFAVIARLIRDGESEEIDESLVKANDNVRYPQLYFTAYGGKNPWANASKWVPYSD